MTNIAIYLHLPWPDRRLSPNKRVSHFVLAKARKNARKVTWAECKKQGWMPKIIWGVDPNEKLELVLQFYPPDNRRRDDDNLIASFKPYRDEIAKQLGIDDSRFSCRAEICPAWPLWKKGKTVVILALPIKDEDASPILTPLI